MLEKKLMEELHRYKSINNYLVRLITEQALPNPDDPNAEETAPADPTADPTAAAPGASGPTDPGVGADAGTDSDLGGGISGGGGGGGLPPEPAAGAGTPPPAGGDTTATEPAEGSTEELDITDLVNMTKNIKQSLEQKTDENAGTAQKMDGIFSKLGELEGRLGEMDQLLSKIDQLGAKVEQMRPQTPQEKLEMRSLDSYPFSQHPTDFFNQKQGEMKASGKNEYVLTKDDVTNYSQGQIRNSFNANNQEYDAVKY